jgi:hypothetical protein
MVKTSPLVKKIIPYILAIALTIATFSMHFGKRADSMINDKNNVISEAYLQYVVDVHKLDPTFTRRPLTTLLIESCASAFKITTGLSFILVNFSLLCLAGILLYKLSEKLGSSFKACVVNMTVFFLCFSNLYAFFPPVYSYDEPLQYCLIFAALIFFFDKKWILFTLTFSVALIARESTMILLPGLALLMVEMPIRLKSLFSRSYIRTGLLLALPLICYLIFLFSYTAYIDHAQIPQSTSYGRLAHFWINFGSPEAAIESFFSAFVVLGVPVYLIISHFKNSGFSSEQKKIIQAFVVTLVINTLIVLLTTKARESRLFALPLFFIWPFFGTFFREEIKTICAAENYLLLFKKWSYLLLFLFLNALNYLVSFKVYKTTGGGDDYFREYLFVVLFIGISHVLISHARRRSVFVPGQ